MKEQSDAIRPELIAIGQSIETENRVSVGYKRPNPVAAVKSAKNQQIAKELYVGQTKNPAYSSFHSNQNKM